MDKIKVALAEDHKKFREIVIQFLKDEQEVEITLEAENGIDLLQKLEQSQPDVILMDIRMPEMDGLQATKISKYPAIKIIAFTEFDFPSNIIKMSGLGVKSFVSKSQIGGIVRAIKIVHGGGVYFPNAVAEILQRYLSYSTPNPNSTKLTEFEEYLLKAICKGHSSTEIGRLLNRSPRTIEEHREKLYKKFGVKVKEQLIAEAFKQNLV